MSETNNLTIKIKKFKNTKKLNELKKLIFETFVEFEGVDYSKDGIVKFIREVLIDDKFLSKRNVFVCECDKKIVGMIATNKKYNKIILLFVDKNYFKNGIGTKLFEKIKSSCTEKIMFVDSSPYAVNFYKKLGFVKIKDEVNVNGFRYTPMNLEL